MVPFYPFLEVLAAACGLAPDPIREEIPARWPHLMWLLPDKHLTQGDSSLDAQDEQQRLFRVVSGFFQAISQEVPIAVLVDDLHWADSVSLKLLLHLARHTRSNRILLLGTYRDAEFGPHHPLARALIDLNRERLVERVVVRPPGPQDSAALIAATLGEVEGAAELATLIHETTGGNPFFVEEVLRALVERGDIYQQGSRRISRNVREIQVPETVHLTIGERLARLPSEWQAVVGEASVLGQVFTFDDLWSVRRRDEEELEQALEEAVRAGLVRETGEDSYAFVHALTQQAVYFQVPSHRRRRLHLAAGEAVAQHFLQGNDSNRAVPYAIQAGDRAQQAFAYSEAERHYRMVLGLIPAARPDTEQEGAIGSSDILQAETLAKLGRVLNITERYDEALAVLEQAAKLCRLADDLDREAQVVAEIGWTHRARRTIEEGIARIEPLVMSLEQANPPRVRPQALSALCTALARLYFSLGRYQQELVAAERGVELARGGDVVLGNAEIQRGAALMNLGHRQPARQAFEKAVVRATASDSVGTMGIALDSLAEICRDGGDFRSSKAYFKQALEVAQRTLVPSRIAWTTSKLGHICFALGDWQEAHAHLDSAAEIFASVETSRLAVYSLLYSQQLALAEGAGKRAVGRIEDILSIADPQRDFWVHRYAQFILAEWDMQQAQPLATLARLSDLLDPESLKEAHVTLLLHVLAWAYLESGNPAQAEEILQMGTVKAQAQGHRLAFAHMIRVRGMLRTQQARWDEAQRDFEQAISLAGSMPFPYGEARARYE